MTAKYPVDIGDDEGIVDAVNYLLSGPAGLGQNFSGFSSYAEVYLTGNFRVPYTQTGASQLYVAPISISNATQLDARTIKYEFTGAPLGSVPFSLGNGVTISGITPADYDTSSLRNAGNSTNQIGVIESTNSYIILRTVADIVGSLPAYVSGGSAEFTSTDAYASTDANGRVTVTGGQDRVFISGQLDQTVSYKVLAATQDLNVYVSINRYKGFLNDDPTNPDYLFNFDDTVAEKKYTYTNLAGSGATFNITKTVATYSAVDINSIGTGYNVGDVLTILGTSLGGATPANDLTITVTAIYPGGGIAKISYAGTAAVGGGPYTNIAGVSTSPYNGTLPLIETVFASLIDKPVPGYYWYILEIYFETNDADMQITTDVLGLRSLSAQVVKQ